jgi:hypothetical protein
MGNSQPVIPRKRGLTLTKDFQSVFNRSKRTNSILRSPPETKIEEGVSTLKRLVRPNGIDFIVPTPPPLETKYENMNNTSSSKSREKDPELEFDLTEGQNRRNLMSEAEFECTEIGEYLFIGGAKVATSWDVLQEKGIRRIVNCSASVVECAFADYPNMKYLVLNMVDGKQDDISWYFCEVINFIYSGHLMGEKTLLHCEKGISRSCSFAIAYGIWYAGCAWSVAFKFIKERRKVCAPNTAFTCNLIEIDDLLNGPSRMLSLIFRCASHLTHDSHTPVLKLCRDPQSRRILTPALSFLDPKGVFVVRAPERKKDDDKEPVIYIWKGSEATEETAEIAQRLAGYMRGIISSAEKLILVREGSEPLEFFQYLEKNDKFDREKSRVYDDLFDQNRYNEPDESFQLIPNDRSMRASHSAEGIDPASSGKSRVLSYNSPPLKKEMSIHRSGNILNTMANSLHFSSRIQAGLNSSPEEQTTNTGPPMRQSLRNSSEQRNSSSHSIQHVPLRTSSMRNFSLNMTFNASSNSLTSVGGVTPMTQEQQYQQQRATKFTLEIPKKRSSPLSSFLSNSRGSGSASSTTTRIPNMPNLPSLSLPSNSSADQLTPRSAISSSTHVTPPRPYQVESSEPPTPNARELVMSPTLPESDILNVPLRDSATHSPTMSGDLNRNSSLNSDEYLMISNSINSNNTSNINVSGSRHPHVPILTSRSNSSVSVGQVYALTSARLERLSQEFSPRAPVAQGVYTARSESTTVSVTARSKATAAIQPLPLPSRIASVNRLPDDISLIRGPTPIEELIPVVTGELTSRDCENPSAPVYSPQFVYTPRTGRTNMFSSRLHSSRPNSPSHTISHFFSSRQSRDIHWSGVSSPHTPAVSSAVDRSHWKPRLYQGVTTDGRQYKWEAMGVYDDTDLFDVSP